MKIASAIIMLIGLFLGFITLALSESAPQQLTSLIPVIGAYVLGRALENLNDKNDTIIRLLNLIEGKLISKEIKKDNTPTTDKKANWSEHKKAEELKAVLKGDEMIIKMKKGKELKIINKSQYEKDKELHIANQYTIIDKN